MLDIISNNVPPQYGAWDCNFTETSEPSSSSTISTACAENSLKHRKAVEELAVYSRGVDIHCLGDDILLHIFTFLTSLEVLNVLPCVCSRWLQLFCTNNEAIYKHLTHKHIYEAYIAQQKLEEEQINKEDADSIITIPQQPSNRFERQFEIVGVPSWKHLYHNLSKNTSHTSELLTKLLFILSAVDGAQARRLPATRSISMSSPALRKSFSNSPITASPLTSTKASSYLSSVLLEGIDIEFLPKELFKLAFLRELDLSNNKLTVIPKELAVLKNLQILYLANNQISSIETVLLSSDGDDANVTTTSRDCISLLTRLEKLDFSGNRLSLFPEDWQFLHNLKELNVSNNCGHSNAKVLPIAWARLSKLQVIWCSNNRIEQLPAEFSQLQCLQKLVADNNHIKSVPLSFSSLGQLRAISLRNNPVEQSLTFLKDALPQLQIQYDPTFAKHSSLGSSSTGEKSQNLGDGSMYKGKENQRKCTIQ